MICALCKKDFPHTIRVKIFRFDMILGVVMEKPVESCSKCLSYLPEESKTVKR